MVENTFNFVNRFNSIFVNPDVKNSKPNIFELHNDNTG